MQQELKVGQSVLTYTIQQQIKHQLDDLQIKFDHDSNSQDFRQLSYILSNILCYPFLNLAELHHDANRLGTYDLKDNLEDQKKILRKAQVEGRQIYCPHCGLIKQEQELQTVGHSLQVLNNVGVSTYLFFKCILKLIVLTLLLFLIYSIFAITVSLKHAGNYAKGNFISSHISFGALQYSSQSELANKDMDILSVLGIICIVAWILALFIVKYYEASGEINQIIDNKSAADYSLTFENVPSHYVLKDLQKEINLVITQQNIGQHIRIQKANMGRPFYEIQGQIDDQYFKTLMKQRQKIKNICTDLLLSRRKSLYFKESVQERSNIYFDFQSNNVAILKAHKNIAKRCRQRKHEEQQQATTTAFITFQDNFTRDRVYSMFRTSLFHKFLQIITFGHFSSSNFVIQTAKVKQQIKVKVFRAPQPEDIIWGNIGVPLSERLCRKVLTYIITIVLLAVSFFVQLLIVQGKSQSKSTFVSFAISFVQVVFNIIIQFIISYLTAKELDYTFTNFQTGLALKLIVAYLLNSILIPILFNLNQGKLYQTSGLAAGVFFFSVNNAIVAPIMRLVGLKFIFNKLMSMYRKKPQRRLRCSQVQLNLLYENGQFQIGGQYIYFINTFLFTCFFLTIQPIIAVTAIFGYIFMYWVQKYVLYHRAKRPIPGTNILNIMMSQLIVLGGLFYVGGRYFTISLSEGVIERNQFLNLVLIVLGILLFLLPYQYIFKQYISNAETFEPFNSYKQNKLYLPTQYDRLNPATAQQALQQYLEFIEQQRYQIQKKPFAEQKEIAQKFLMQGKKWRRRQLDKMSVYGESNLEESIVKTFLKKSEENSINPRLLGSIMVPNQVFYSHFYDSHRGNQMVLRGKRRTGQRTKVELPQIQANPYNDLTKSILSKYNPDNRNRKINIGDIFNKNRMQNNSRFNYD